jgi:hypothetical protein
MRKSRPRYPHPRDLGLVKAVLQNTMPMDTSLTEGWRYSVNNVPNYRFQGVTQGLTWFMDVYAGHHYVITVSDRSPEICKSIPSSVNYLRRMLGVRG